MEDTEFITRRFNCKICNTTHSIRLNKNLKEGKTRFPFSYIYLHGDLKDILTILYLDKELNIRGVETEKLSIENIFSKEQMVDIVGKLVEEIETLREDYNRILNENIEFKKKLEKKSNKALSTTPQDLKGWMKKGVKLGRLENYKEALICFEEAIKIETTSSMAWNNKGYSLEKLKSIEKAILCYEKAVGIDPENKTAVNNLRNIKNKKKN